MSTNDDDNKFLYTFTKNILNSDKSIRWVGIIDKNGIIINEHSREGLKPFLTKEENQESAINTIIRHKTRKKYEAKIGKITYTFGRYENLTRSIIPINENYYLLLNIDFEEKNFDKIVVEKIIPLRFIEDNWSLGRIGKHSYDEKADSILNLFDFDKEKQQQLASPLFLDPSIGLPISHR